ncbi:carbohydrate-binding module family 1 protein [Sodiomyces alcalophilus JCM 7366]|uniref:carbohydrate-binding module family 1 protein n=1 Tax=Sodiomyces alcalophilus JCM 7366 TaxID=591952 RepID=UPI0039B5114D
MRSFSAAGAATLLSAFSLLNGAMAQIATPWTHPDSGIVYNTWTTSSGMTFGMALPSDALTNDATEYIGYYSCPTPQAEGEGYCGLSLGGTMQRNMLVMAYPYEDEVFTQLFYAPSYDFPEIYTGDATVTQISSKVNATHYEIEFRCQDCWSWDHGGEIGSISTSAGFLILGWAHSFSSPENAQCPANIVVEQHDRQSIFGTGLDPSIADARYDDWVELATITATGDCGGSTPPPSSTVEPSEPAPTSSHVPPETGVPVPDESYDYIIVGSGAGGIPVADKLSEAGHKVLLIEKGPPSSGRWGGTRGPWWLQDTNLTRFDVPGLCNEIWHDSAGIACRDTDQMSGCVLGGGTAINAALWWKPYGLDWDYNFPAGWKASDMAAAEQRVFSRIPGTTRPSMDGQIYLTQGMDVIRNGLRSGGWNEVDFLSNPNAKNHTFGYTPYMFSNGERGGPMATYLATAMERPNFTLWMNTAVRRVIRQGGKITGVEVEPYLEGGYQGVVPLTATGSVVLSAGTFGSAKILMRSGIGPEDQLEVVKNSAVDGATMISRDQWINLPVGYNLEDHVNTNTVLRHPSAQFYDFYTAYDGEDEFLPDINQYLSSRTGILAQSAPNIGPLFFDEITGADGIVRQLQWTARIEGSEGEPDGDSITISQYLGRGATSRGRMTLTANLNTIVSDVPYLKDSEDVEAVIKGIENLQKALAGVPNLEWLHPAPNVSAREYVENMLVSYANRRANHWIGTAKLGTNDGRNGGDAVVDLNTKVYGTDNLYVVDASIFPGHVTPNPSSYIVVAAEHAAQRILQSRQPAEPTQPGEWEQCGGLEYTGPTQCANGLRCVELNPYYFQVGAPFIPPL